MYGNVLRERSEYESTTMTTSLEAPESAAIAAGAGEGGFSN